MKRRTLLAVGTGSLLAAPSVIRAQASNGVALVIGNSKYQWEAALPNVRRDAPDIAKSFQALGLKTELIQDVGRDGLLAALAKFKSAASGANLAAFYFAGHGVTWAKQTYVVPVDADLGDPKSVQKLVTVADIEAAMLPAARRFLVFDNCRNNPADGWRQREARAQAKIEAHDKPGTVPNTLTLYSTASGAIALDGPPGGNSPFAAALLRQLGGSSVDLTTLAPKLRRDLLLATEGRQLLWDQSTYNAPFAIAGSGKAPAPAATQIDPSRIVELPKAYAYAQKNGLPLPPGLVACRPAPGSPNARMIGSFEYSPWVSLGVSAAAPHPMPAVINVLSVSGGSAEFVVAAKDYQTGGSGGRWRFGTGTFIENGFEYFLPDGTTRVTVVWADQNSGKHSTLADSPGRVNLYKPVPFTRLDG